MDQKKIKKTIKRIRIKVEIKNIRNWDLKMKLKKIKVLQKDQE
jgi:hypothetical protein